MLSRHSGLEAGMVTCADPAVSRVRIAAHPQAKWATFTRFNGYPHQRPKEVSLS